MAAFEEARRELHTAAQRRDSAFVHRLCMADREHPAVRAAAEEQIGGAEDQYQEWLAHLPARGRVQGTSMQGHPTVNPFGVVNGARLERFEPETRTVTLRVDDTHVPEFWLEVELPLDRLRAWVQLAEQAEQELLEE